MIIDEILDRKDGGAYDAKDFYSFVMEEESIWDLPRDISRALDSGENEDVQKALCNYIIEQGYNPAICDFVKSQVWI